MAGEVPRLCNEGERRDRTAEPGDCKGPVGAPTGLGGKFVAKPAGTIGLLTSLRDCNDGEVIGVLTGDLEDLDVDVDAFAFCCMATPAVLEGCDSVVGKAIDCDANGRAVVGEEVV